MSDKKKLEIPVLTLGYIEKQVNRTELDMEAVNRLRAIYGDKVTLDVESDGSSTKIKGFVDTEKMFQAVYEATKDIEDIDIRNEREVVMIDDIAQQYHLSSNVITMYYSWKNSKEAEKEFENTQVVKLDEDDELNRLIEQRVDTGKVVKKSFKISEKASEKILNDDSGALVNSLLKTIMKHI